MLALHNQDQKNTSLIEDTPIINSNVVIWVKYTASDSGILELQDFHDSLSWFSSLKIKSFKHIPAGESIWSSLSLILKEVLIKNELKHQFLC